MTSDQWQLLFSKTQLLIWYQKPDSVLSLWAIWYQMNDHDGFVLAQWTIWYQMNDHDGSVFSHWAIWYQINDYDCCVPVAQWSAYYVTIRPVTIMAPWYWATFMRRMRFVTLGERSDIISITMMDPHVSVNDMTSGQWPRLFRKTQLLSWYQKPETRMTAGVLISIIRLMTSMFP